MEASEYFKNLGATSVCISSQKDGRKQVTICFPHKKTEMYVLCSIFMDFYLWENT